MLWRLPDQEGTSWGQAFSELFGDVLLRAIHSMRTSLDSPSSGLARVNREYRYYLNSLSCLARRLTGRSKPLRVTLYGDFL